MATSSNQQWLPYDMVDGLWNKQGLPLGVWGGAILCLSEIAVDLYQKLKRDKIYPPPNVIILPCSHGMKREKREGQQSGNLTPYNNVYYTAKMNMARTWCAFSPKMWSQTEYYYHSWIIKKAVCKTTLLTSHYVANPLSRLFGFEVNLYGKKLLQR